MNEWIDYLRSHIHYFTWCVRIIVVKVLIKILICYDCHRLILTLSRRRSLSYRNQSIDLQRIFGKTKYSFSHRTKETEREELIINLVFEGWSYFNLSNLGLVLGMVLETYISVAMRVKSKSQKNLRANSYVWMYFRENLLGKHFCPTTSLLPTHHPE